MTTFTINSNQKPSKDTLERLLNLRDEDIVYDDDCPELTPEMEENVCHYSLGNRED